MIRLFKTSFTGGVISGGRPTTWSMRALTATILTRWRWSMRRRTMICSWTNGGKISTTTSNITPGAAMAVATPITPGVLCSVSDRKSTRLNSSHTVIYTLSLHDALPIFMDEWRQNQHDDEQYHAWGGNGGGDTHYTWGALLCLVGLEQYIDVNPWDGLRFGMLNPPSAGELDRALWQGHLYNIRVGPSLTELTRDGHLRFRASGGVVVRRYDATPTRLSFTLHGAKSARVTTYEWGSGTPRLEIDGKSAGRVTIHQGVASFNVPSGEHRIVLEE